MPYDFLTLTGTVVPDTSTLKAEVQAEFRAALGDDLSLDDETPQGVLIIGEVQSRAAAAANNAALANQINPDLAGGVFLDAICALLGEERDAQTRTLVRDVNLYGVAGTFLPAGTRARTAEGDVFESVGAVTLLPPNPSIPGPTPTRVDFLAVNGGPVPCPPGSLVLIVDAVLGWEAVQNDAAGILGSFVQSDESLRLSRRQTLARQGQSTPVAVTSALYALPDVRSLQFRENITDADMVIDGILLRYHSVWTCVDGGTDNDIALALLGSKTASAGWTGAVTVNVVEPSSGQTYLVKFDRPTDVPVLLRVTVRRGTYVGDLAALVESAVLDYAAGALPGEQGFVVGGNVSPFEIAGALGVRASGVFVAKVEVAPVPGPGDPLVYQTDEYVIDIDEVATIQASSITLVELP